MVLLNRNRVFFKYNNTKVYICLEYLFIDMTTEVMNLHVLAIARPESNVVCVAGINDDGEWIRPQRIYENDIETGGKINFALFGITRIHVDIWRGKTIRPEDRFLIKKAGEAPELIRYLKSSETRALLESHLDTSADAVFKSGRTLGLIKPQKISRVSEDTNKIRITFQDPTGQQFTWSVRDLLFYKKFSIYNPSSSDSSQYPYQ